MSMFVIGLVGEKGSGKGTFAKHLAETAMPKSVLSVRFSDILYDTLALWGISPSRENLQKIAVVIERGFGAGTLANAVARRLAKLEADIIIVEGVRWDSDEALIRSLPNNTLVYVTAPAEIRYARTVKRGEKAGESETSFEQFMREEKALNELNIPLIGARADYKIVNDGSVASYQAAIVEFCRACNL